MHAILWALLAHICASSIRPQLAHICDGEFYGNAQTIATAPPATLLQQSFTSSQTRAKCAVSATRQRHMVPL